MCVCVCTQPIKSPVMTGCVHLFLVRALSLIILMMITNMMIIRKQLHLRQSSPQAQSQEERGDQIFLLTTFLLNSALSPVFITIIPHALTDSYSMCSRRQEAPKVIPPLDEMINFTLTALWKLFH